MEKASEEIKMDGWMDRYTDRKRYTGRRMNGWMDRMSLQLFF